MNKHSVGSIAVAMLLAWTGVGCERVPEPAGGPRSAKPASSEAPEPTELVKEDLKVGEGSREVKTGDTIKVNYVGKLAKNGSMFDSNKSKEAPFSFTVGEGVIPGWSQGVVGMKKGGKRKLTIPSSLGYGDSGSPPKIPGKATLVFEIDLLGWDGEEPAPEASATPSVSASASAAPSAAPAAGSAAASAKPAAGPAAK
jgi:FKBP-type peptidyl-prolyl cis-trans isomerase FkpA